jgi:hypothetical protein
VSVAVSGFNLPSFHTVRGELRWNPRVLQVDTWARGDMRNVRPELTRGLSPALRGCCMCRRVLLLCATLCALSWPVFAQPQAEILTPAPAVNAGPMLVTGYAYDSLARNSPGIRSVSVWAFPNAQPPGIYLGEAVLGDDRTDFARAFGLPANFNTMGYSLTVPAETLAPGTYDLLVFANSSVSAAATYSTLRITVLPQLLGELTCSSGEIPVRVGARWTCAPPPGGPAGPQGEPGATGAQGLTGPAGPAGPTGPIGPQGLPGVTGAQGLTGPAGAAGPPGPIGPQGLPGATGAQGLTGPAGAAGPTGPIGPQGLTGATGAQGLTGPAGAVGPTGPIGPQGLTGATGAQGPPGPIGPQGTPGPSWVFVDSSPTPQTIGPVFPIQTSNAGQTAVLVQTQAGDVGTILIERSGFNGGAARTYYASTNCTGQPYVLYNPFTFLNDQTPIINGLAYMASDQWTTAGAVGLRSWRSAESVGCVPLNDAPFPSSFTEIAPASGIDVSGFVPPFKAVLR